MTFPIITWPHPLLRIALKEDFSPVSLEWLKQLWATMYANDAIGLAANQIGSVRRVFIMQVPGRVPRVFINPKIIEAYGSCKAPEGCLSFPGCFLNIERPTEVKIETNDQGEKSLVSLTGLEAKVAHHEIDHLDGIVFEDRL